MEEKPAVLFSGKGRVLVVAEIGNNHEGEVEVAKELVRKAAECGVDAVKFQTFQTRYFISPADGERYDRLRGFELSYSEFEELHRLAKSLGLLFFSTPLDLESARFLADLVDAFKVASADNNFYPLLETVCDTGRPLILSSGFADLGLIGRSVRFIRDRWKLRGIEEEMAVLHCVGAYPVPPDEVGLTAIPLMREALGCPVGYSDHTLGIQACLAAVALGAVIIEKHFTLSKSTSSFRDHQLSADPAELRLLVEQVGVVARMMGRPQKVVLPCEQPSLPLVRRSIASKGNLLRGHILSWEDLVWLRPGTGLPPGEEARLLGRMLKRDVSAGELFSIEDFD